MKNLVFKKEEHDTNPAAIQALEELLGSSLPAEYRDFLLDHNGCTVFPDTPSIKADTDWDLWAVERFLSVGDLVLQAHHPMEHDMREMNEEYDAGKYPIDFSKLITIAIGQRGCYQLYLGAEDHGRLYFSCYSDWDGLVKLFTTSFNEFLSSFVAMGDPSDFPGNRKPRKIFEPSLFHTHGQPEAGFNRFKEVLHFYGDPNETEPGYENVVQRYVNNQPYLEYLLANGGRTDGLLNHTRDFDTIRYLVDTHKMDLNQPFEGWYPLQYYTSAASMHDFMVSYHLMDKLLAAGYTLDLSVKDENGKTVTDRLRKVVEGYEKYRAYEIQRNGKPESTAMTSEHINRVLAEA